MTIHERYLKTNKECIDGHGKEVPVWTVNGNGCQEKVYTYDEAIDLAGNGKYVFTMLGVLACAFMGMALDMFGFAVIVTSACDLDLTHDRKKILLSMPFLGSILMAYPWGYISDTQGRLKGLLIALWGSFILAFLSTLSPNWIVLAVLKFGSSSFASGVQSLSFTLLGESCSTKFKGTYLLGVATTLVFTFSIYSVLGYFILGLDFALNLGFVVFKPWRLLALVLALPLGVAALFVLFFHESPKFLLNAGDEKKALSILVKISKGNGIKAENYPVKKVILNETTSLKRKDTSLVQSLLDQILPLFKQPLLWRTLQLFYITAVIYSSNNGFFAWLPFVADAFYSGYSVNGTITADNLCSMLALSSEGASTSTCIPTVKEFTMWISIIQCTIFGILHVVVTLLSSRRKIVLMILLGITVLCGILNPLLHGRILTIFLFYGFLINALAMAVIFSYYVDVFPTSYRGMASCLGVMVSRISALIGTYLVGTYLVSHCAHSFYAWSAYILSGIIMCGFLPQDKQKKKDLKSPN